VKRKAGLHKEHRKILDRALSSLDSAIASLRKYIGELQPNQNELGLVDCIRAKVNDAHYSTLFLVNLNLQMEEDSIFDPNRINHIVEILGESLSNIARHASAKNVDIQAARKNEDLVLTIEDDGKGFTLESQSSGFGLRNMRDRTRLLGGNLEVDSLPNQGTKITLTVPWEETH
ncbi:MAG: ATP-binding protein, partial [Chloroflexota bacterium]